MRPHFIRPLVARGRFATYQHGREWFHANVRDGRPRSQAGDGRGDRDGPRGRRRGRPRPPRLLLEGRLSDPRGARRRCARSASTASSSTTRTPPARRSCSWTATRSASRRPLRAAGERSRPALHPRQRRARPGRPRPRLRRGPGLSGEGRPMSKLCRPEVERRASGGPELRRVIRGARHRRATRNPPGLRTLVARRSVLLGMTAAAARWPSPRRPRRWTTSCAATWRPGAGSSSCARCRASGSRARWSCRG